MGKQRETQSGVQVITNNRERERESERESITCIKRGKQTKRGKDIYIYVFELKCFFHSHFTSYPPLFLSVSLSTSFSFSVSLLLSLFLPIFSLSLYVYFFPIFLSLSVYLSLYFSLYLFFFLSLFLLNLRRHLCSLFISYKIMRYFSTDFLFIKYIE